MNRTRTLAKHLALAAICAAALGVSATGAQAAGVTAVYAKAIPEHGYQMRLILIRENGSRSAALGIDFIRTVGTARPGAIYQQEEHYYSFPLTAGSIKVSKHSGAISIDTGTQMRQYGRIKMKLVSTVAGGGTPPGCTGRWEVRNGTMQGAFHLVADSTYFHTIDLSRLKVFVSRTAVGSCKKTVHGAADPEPCTHGSGLGIVQPPMGLTMSVTRDSSDPNVTFSAYVSEISTPTPGPLVIHSAVETTPAGALTVADDLTSATGNGGMASPLFDGTFTYAALPGIAPEPITNRCGTGSGTIGTLTGAPVVHFDSIGDQTTDANAIATLTRV